MEIFLLLLIILLIFIFQSNNKSNVEAISKPIQELDKTLKQIQNQESISNFKKEEKRSSFEETYESYNIEIRPVVTELKKEEIPIEEKPTIEPEEEFVPKKAPEIIDIHEEVFRAKEVPHSQKPNPRKEPEIS